MKQIIWVKFIKWLLGIKEASETYREGSFKLGFRFTCSVCGAEANFVTPPPEVRCHRCGSVMDYLGRAPNAEIWTREQNKAPSWRDKL